MRQGPREVRLLENEPRLLCLSMAEAMNELSTTDDNEEPS